MRWKIIMGLVIALALIAGAWGYVGSMSDRLAGNLTILAGAPHCDDPSSCDRYRALFIADAHSDTLLHRDPSIASDAGHVDIRRLVKGGVNLQIFALASVAPELEKRGDEVCGSRDLGDRLTKLFVAKEPLRPATWVSPVARIQRMIDRFEGAAGATNENTFIIHKIETKADLAAVRKAGRADAGLVGAVLAIEGAYWAAHDKAELVRQLDVFEAAGVRMIGLTHRASNHLAGSNEDCTDRRGLTALGRFMVSEIWRRHMVLDLAHASSEAIKDVAELSANGLGGPVVVSHTGIQSACKHDRNLTDEDVRNVARAGGVVAIGFWSTVNCFEDGVSGREARQAIARSFETAYQILNAPQFVAEIGAGYAAINHLALGSDFDGATLVPANSSAMPWYLEGLAQFELDGQRVFDSAAIKKIAGDNLFRLLEEALKP